MRNRKEATVKSQTSQLQPPGLYLVATPIGNLRDITLRALDILQAADLIVCEDTRVTARLLSHYGIKKPTLSYNDHNGDIRRPVILKALAEGKRVALVSDAGTPLISDPGYKLATAARAQGFYVTVIPGASSVLAALSLSGLPCDRFFFVGFLPAKKEACRKQIKMLAGVPSTLVVFESARRLPETLALLSEELGDRKATVARELTKRFEEVKNGVLSELRAHYQETGAPKGEIVIVVSPPSEEAAALSLNLEAELKRLLISHSVKEASAELAELTGRPRKEIYALALTLKHGQG